MVRVARILSLDVVLGACINAWFVAKIAQTSLDFRATLALAICVWLIYTADHLRDAFRLTHEAHTPRHRFHQKYFRPILGTSVFLAGVGLLLLFFLPSPVVRWGTGLMLLVVMYFLVSQIAPIQRVVPKELMIAVLYAGGIFLPVVAQLAFITPELYVLFGQYVMLALVNLLIFAWYEYDSDRLDFTHSLATQYGKAKAKQLIFLGCFGVIASVFWSGFVFADHRSFIISQFLVLMMLALLLAIIIWPRFFGQHERYRWFGDGVFMLPVLGLPFV